MRNIRFGIIGALITLSFLALPTYAQTKNGHLATIQVDIWPDYDQPSVLVLVTAVLPSDVELPAMVSINIPASAGEPSAVATLDDSGNMFTTEYTSELNGDVAMVTVQTAEPRVRIEYYYPYAGDGNQINFDYQWLGGMATDEMVILFREPEGATAVQTGGDFVDVGLQSDGQRYHQWAAGSLEKDSMLSASFSYTLSESAPTSGASADSGEHGESDLYPILFAGGGLVVGGLAGWLLANHRPRKYRPIVSSRKPAANRPAAFCHQCGARIKGGDTFCRQCGEKVA